MDNKRWETGKKRGGKGNRRYKKQQKMEENRRCIMFSSWFNSTCKEQKIALTDLVEVTDICFLCQCWQVDNELTV